MPEGRCESERPSATYAGFISILIAPDDQRVSDITVLNDSIVR